MQLPPAGNSEFIKALIRDVVSDNPQEGQVHILMQSHSSAFSHDMIAADNWTFEHGLQDQVGQPLRALAALRAPSAAMPQLQGR